MNIAPADLIRNIEAGRAWSSLPMSEQIALRAMVRRIVAMANDGTTAEDWQQLAGYAEWAHKSPAPQPALSVHGQWIERCDFEHRLPLKSDLQIEVRLRGGSTLKGAAYTFHWDALGRSGDIVAYRIVD